MTQINKMTAPVGPAVTHRPLTANGQMPSRLAGLAGVQARAQSEFLTPGEYLLEIRKVEEKLTRAPALRPYFVVEASVLGNEDATGAKGQNRVGHTVVYMVMLDRDGALRDVRAFLDAACTPEQSAKLDTEAADELVAELTGPTQPLRGRQMMCAAENIKTRKGNDFTKVRWFAVPADMIPANS